MTERGRGAEVESVDVVVVGLGPGGEAVATKLASAGLDVVAVEQHLVGGECPYYGCVPSKMMVRAADALAEARRVPGLAGASTVEPDWGPVAGRIRQEATDGWDDAVAVRRLEDAGAAVVHGRGRLVGERCVEVGDRVIEARRAVVLNPGTAPAAPPVSGLDGTPYWTNREVVAATEVPRRLAVLGGGAIGCELAQAFRRFGAEVVLVEVAPRLLAPEEPEASELVQAVFEREGIEVRTGVRVDRVEHDDDGFRLVVDGDALGADRLLVAAGRTPQLRGLGLDAVGLDDGLRSLDVDEWMRVLVPGDQGAQPLDWLYAVGDVIGRGAWTHMSMYEASLVVGTVLDAEGPVADFQAVPRVTFTDPEVGSVGITEQQARDRGLEVRTGLARLPDSSRGWIHKSGNEGFVKLVVAGDELVGATSVGPSGGEVLGIMTTAMHGRVPVSRLASQIFPYPTFSGAVRDALTDLGV